MAIVHGMELANVAMIVGQEQPTDELQNVPGIDPGNAPFGPCKCAFVLLACTEAEPHEVVHESGATVHLGHRQAAVVKDALGYGDIAVTIVMLPER